MLHTCTCTPFRHHKDYFHSVIWFRQLPIPYCYHAYNNLSYWPMATVRKVIIIIHVEIPYSYNWWESMLKGREYIRKTFDTHRLPCNVSLTVQHNKLTIRQVAKKGHRTQFEHWPIGQHMCLQFEKVRVLSPVHGPCRCSMVHAIRLLLIGVFVVFILEPFSHLQVH